MDWVRALLARRMAGPGPAEESVLAAAARALDEAVASGTGVFGDVSNSLATVPLLERRADAAVVFHELLGFRSAQAEPLVAAGRDQRAQSGAAHVRVSVAPHAPYSVSPALFQAIGRELDATPGSITTLHLAESPEEVELLKQGTGPWRPLLDELGAWEPEWTPPGTSPVQYAAALGYLDRPTLVVHGVQCTPADIGALASQRGHPGDVPEKQPLPRRRRPAAAGLLRRGRARRHRHRQPGQRADPQHVRRDGRRPKRRARRCRRGGFSRAPRGSEPKPWAAAIATGTSRSGAAPGLIAVRVPEGVRDVEEYLVSGIPPDRVSWAWRPRGAEPQTS